MSTHLVFFLAQDGGVLEAPDPADTSTIFLGSELHVEFSMFGSFHQPIIRGQLCHQPQPGSGSGAYALQPHQASWLLDLGKGQVRMGLFKGWCLWEGWDRG